MVVTPQGTPAVTGAVLAHLTDDLCQLRLVILADEHGGLARPADVGRAEAPCHRREEEGPAWRLDYADESSCPGSAVALQVSRPAPIFNVAGLGIRLGDVIIPLYPFPP